MIRICFIILLFLFLPTHVSGHSGGTNAEGCHTNRKTGEYHCHNKKIKLSKSKKHNSSFEDKSPSTSSNKRPAVHPDRNRIYQWVDENGKVYYSDNLDDLPLKAKESLGSK